MENKDSTQYLALKEDICNLKEQLTIYQNKNDNTLKALEDKVHLLDKQDAITDTQIKSIFKILNEIKDSIQNIAISLEEKPSLDDYTRKQIDNMEKEMKVLKEEEGKTYKHIKVAVLTSLMTGAVTLVITKVFSLM